MKNESFDRLIQLRDEYYEIINSEPVSNVGEGFWQEACNIEKK